MKEKDNIKENKQHKIQFTAIIIIIAIIVAVGIIALFFRNIPNEGTEQEIATVDENVEEQEEIEEYVTVLDDGTKLNTSEVLSEKKTLNGLEVTDTQLTYANGIATLLATVTNTTDERIEQKNVKVDILDAEGNTLMTLHGLIDPVDAGGSVQLNMNVSADIANAYDFTIYE